MENKRYFNKNDLKHGLVIRDEKFWNYYDGVYGGGLAAYNLSDVRKARVIIWGVWLYLNERKAVHWGDYDGTLEFVASGEPGVYVLRECREPPAPVEKWIIWNPASNKPVTTTYSSEAQAIAVAEKLAKENPGETFNIAKITGGRKAEFTMKSL